MLPSLMVVTDIDLSGSGARPAKDHSPLIVDSDAVSTSETASQGLEPVAGRRPQVAQCLGVVENVELPCGDLRDSRPASAPWRPPVEEEPLYLTFGKPLNRHDARQVYLDEVYLFKVIANNSLGTREGTCRLCYSRPSLIWPLKLYTKTKMASFSSVVRDRHRSCRFPLRLAALFFEQRFELG